MVPDKDGKGETRPCQVSHWWISDELSQSNSPHPQCWREIRVSRKLSTGVHVIQGEHDEHTTQHYALWQVTAFRLPLTQQEASGWWDAPLFPQDVCPPASNPWNFQVIHQEKSLVLARCCRPVQRHLEPHQGSYVELSENFQQCMAQLMSITGDNVMEASLSPCWVQWKKNQELPPWKKRQPSWAGKLGT